jgi:hypothetical protein
LDETETRNCITEAAREVGVKIKSLQRRPLSSVWHIDIVGYTDQIRFEPPADASPQECARKFKNLVGFWDYSHPSFIEDQINLLRVHSREDVFAAMQRLQEVGEPAVEPLIQALIDENEPMIFRARVADTLETIGDPRSIGPLIQMLNESHVLLRWHAVQALAKMGDARAVGALERLAANETERLLITPTLEIDVKNAAQTAIHEIKKRNA